MAKEIGCLFPVMETIFPGYLASLDMITCPPTAEIIAKNKRNESTWPPICPELNLIEHLGIMDSMCINGAGL